MLSRDLLYRLDTLVSSSTPLLPDRPEARNWRTILTGRIQDPKPGRSWKHGDLPDVAESVFQDAVYGRSRLPALDPEGDNDPGMIRIVVETSDGTHRAHTEYRALRSNYPGTGYSWGHVKEDGSSAWE